jgi:hypothetical protein
VPLSLLSQATVAALLQSLRHTNFNTLQFAEHVKKQEPALYRDIETKYGPGGKGAGRHYSSVTFVAKSLAMYVRNWTHNSGAPELRFTEYVPAPKSHGSPVIATWSLTQANDMGEELEKDIEAILADEGLTPSEKKRWVNARRGQGKYRDQLIKHWKACPLTLCSDDRVLVASHIKRWSESTRLEQVDPFNGILLSPSADRLFDRGLISFADDGQLLRSDLLHLKVLQQLGVPRHVRIQFNPGHLPYLAHHRHRWLGK